MVDSAGTSDNNFADALLSPRKKSHLEICWGEIHVGDEHQAIVDDYSEPKEPYDEDRDECVWMPTKVLSRSSVDSYVADAKHESGLPEDAALALLFRNNYALVKARSECSGMTSKVRRTSDLRVLRRAFQLFRKLDLRKVKHLLPRLSVFEIVDHYYYLKSLGKHSLYVVDKFDARQIISLRQSSKAKSGRVIFSTRVSSVRPKNEAANGCIKGRGQKLKSVAPKSLPVAFTRRKRRTVKKDSSLTKCVQVKH